jgi:hypothetical protein
MLRAGRVHDPEHSHVGVATFVGLILFTESTRGGYCYAVQYKPSIQTEKILCMTCTY